MSSILRVVFEGVAAQVVSVTVGVFAGIGLAYMRGALEELPGMIILVPAFLEMRGNVSGTFASRLGTALHMGIVKPYVDFKNQILKANVFGTFTLGVIESIFIAFFTYTLCLVFNFKSMGLINLVLLMVIAGLLSNIVMIFLTLYSTMYVYRRGLDPDTFMGPYITSVGDVVSIICLFIASYIVMVVSYGYV